MDGLCEKGKELVDRQDTAWPVDPIKLRPSPPGAATLVGYPSLDRD